MKKIVIGLVFVLAFSAAPAFADEESTGALNDLSGFYYSTKEVINRLDASYETLWLISHGDFSQGASGALYQFTDEEIPIASIRLGAGTNENLYGGVSLDLPGITKRYVPKRIKSFSTIGPLDTLWSFAGKHARVGIAGGYSWGYDEPIYGLTAGAAFNW